VYFGHGQLASLLTRMRSQKEYFFFSCDLELWQVTLALELDLDREGQDEPPRQIFRSKVILWHSLTHTHRTECSSWTIMWSLGPASWWQYSQTARRQWRYIRSSSGTDGVSGGGSGGRRRVSAPGAHLGHGVLGRVGAILGLLQFVLHLAILGQVDRCDLLLHRQRSTTCSRNRHHCRQS